VTDALSLPIIERHERAVYKLMLGGLPILSVHTKRSVTMPRSSPADRLIVSLYEPRLTNEFPSLISRCLLREIRYESRQVRDMLDEWATLAFLLWSDPGDANYRIGVHGRAFYTVVETTDWAVSLIPPCLRPFSDINWSYRK